MGIRLLVRDPHTADLQGSQAVVFGEVDFDVLEFHIKVVFLCGLTSELVIGDRLRSSEDDGFAHARQLDTRFGARSLVAVRKLDTRFEDGGDLAVGSHGSHDDCF